MFSLECLRENRRGGRKTVGIDKKRPLHIEKECVRVIILTHHYKIIGDMYIPRSGRLSDYLNKTLAGAETDIFIPVTNAECFAIEDGQLKYIAEFISINKNHIHLIFPYKGK